MRKSAFLEIKIFAELQVEARRTTNDGVSLQMVIQSVLDFKRQVWHDFVGPVCSHGWGLQKISVCALPFPGVKILLRGSLKPLNLVWGFLEPWGLC